jgi:hypothetical protein
VLIPAAALPRLDPQPFPLDELTTLDRATAPTIVTEDDDDSGGCMCMPTIGAAGGKGGDTSRVQVTAPVDIGPVTAVVLNAESPQPLLAWLAEHRFVIPAEDQPLVAAYSKPGRYFVALRRNAQASHTGATSVGVRMTIPGDQRGLPLRFARIGARPQVAFTVFVTAQGAFGPSPPFAGLTLEMLPADELRWSYAVAVAKAVAAKDGRAFVVEGAHSRQLLYERGALGPQLFALSRSGDTVTRMSTVLARETLTADVAFMTKLADLPSSTRTLAAGTGGGTWLLAGVALAGVVARRRRRGPADATTEAPDGGAA